MSLLAKVMDATASVFCHHEWSSKHEPHRWYLECMRCGATTGGINVGREALVAAAPAQHRRRSFALLKPSSRAAA